MAKKDGKKVMVAAPAKGEWKDAIDAVRKAIVNKFLEKNSAKVKAHENAHGAFQIRRSSDGQLLASFRKDGKAIITHPILNKAGEPQFPVAGTGWNDRSHVPFEQVTVAMLEARLKDPRTLADLQKIYYPGKKAEESGLSKKLAAAKARAEKAKADAKPLKADAKASKAKAEATVKARKAKKASKAVRKVAAEIVTEQAAA